MNPEGLLEVAEALVRQGPGRPSEERVRRSISTSYYALFTALTAEYARPYLPSVQPAARRLVEHGKTRSVCIGLEASSSDNLREFATLFLHLWLRRQRADYDHTYDPKNRDAENAIEQARAGIEYLSRARVENPDQVQMMCVKIVATDAQRKQIGQQAGGI